LVTDANRNVGKNQLLKLIIRYLDLGMTTWESLERACELAGGQKALAEAIGTGQSQVWYWLKRSKKGVPAEFVLKIEQATGVPRHEIRPDIFPPPQEH
jgi:DNA-binding transcriptional regulator YdaS (Cro superfamily)